jgi:tRNA threonylcarbamoyladenosine biosynthesis protein TsaE
MDRKLEPIAVHSCPLNNLDEVSELIIKKLQEQKICIIEGEMGAGKTTLIKALCNRLGVEDTVSSPTFSIVNEYNAKGNPVYHFDFYRVKSLEEALNVGVEEYFYSNNYCFIEWPDIILDLLPAEYLKIHITFGTNDDRNYKLINHGAH